MLGKRHYEQDEEVDNEVDCTEIVGLENKALRRANDIINIFFKVDDSSEVFPYHPTFTHQIFDDEIIPLFSINTNISIEIDCRNMEQKLILKNCGNKLEYEELSTKISKALPNDAIQLPNFNAIGLFLQRFELGENSFEFRLVSHNVPLASQIIAKAEKIAVWFIETADSIDFSDDRWEAIFLFKILKNPSSTTAEIVDSIQNGYALVGYVTLFSFQNPIVGTKLRICQALIFPNYQRQGLGQKMVVAVYELAKNRDAVVEVTVEDPAPGFQILRDQVDYEWCIQQLDNEQDSILFSLVGKTVMTALQLNQLKKRLKITLSQTIFINETMNYYYLFVSESNPMNKDYRTFRLAVKRRLLKENSELNNLPKESMQLELEELYNLEVNRYKTTLNNNRIKILLNNLERKKFFNRDFK